MKNIFLLFACFAITSFAVAQLNEPYVVRNTASPCLNVRDDHNAGADVVTCIPPGTAITVVSSIPFWREITFGNNQRG